MSATISLQAGSSFLVEDFINSITVQLDRVQDALRLKSLNRPLNYALKDFSLDLQVFVELDQEGHVRFRTSSPNETGSSTVRLGFTTITRPMIDENTISLAATRSPSLDQIGLEPDQRKKLEQLGVHNAAQLQTLYSSTNAGTVSRLTDLPIDRLRQALEMGKPNVTKVTPVKSPPSPIVPQPPATPPVIRVPQGIPHLQLRGSGLLGPSGPPSIRLNKELLSLAHADDDRVVVNLPENAASGALEVTLGDGDVAHYHVEIEPHNQPPHGQLSVHADRWEPPKETM
ncbi:MAG TPA: hypothetical protein VLN48_04705 [Bryobacteraceae bacterium]|nr:hypothetical protein [Bryobacteraceae bacterium]